MKFAHPDALLLLWLLPLVALLAVLEARRRRRALLGFAEAGLLLRFVAPDGRAAPWLRGALLTLAAFCLVLAAARPLLGVRYIPVKRQGVDIVIALDTSASMDARDVRPSRLERAKQEILELLDRARGDRVALVVFAGNAYVQCPLTLDYGAVRLVLDAVETDASPVPGTALAAAIRTATGCFDEKERRYRALVLITDGEDHEGSVLEAAREAADGGARLFAIGMGSPAGEPVPTRDEQGHVSGYKSDEAGRVVMSRLDEETLVRIAEIGHGRYVRGGAGPAGAGSIYPDIADMEEREVKGGFVAQYKDRFHYAMIAAFALLAFEAFWAARRRVRPSAWLLVLLLAWPATAGAGAAGDVRKGNSATRKGDFAEALRHYEAALAERPGDPVIRYDMGLALQELGRTPDAQSAYLDALASPSAGLRADAHYNLGNAFYRQGKLPEAIDAYRRALRERPEDRDARHNLEMALRGMQQASRSGESGRERSGQADQDSTREGDQSERGQQNERERESGGAQQREQRGAEEQRRAGADTLGQGTPKDTTAAGEPQPARLTRQQAEQLLRALERAEQEAQRERMRARAVEQRPGKDW